MHQTGGKPSWADMCRQKAADAKQRAAQAKDVEALTEGGPLPFGDLEILGCEEPIIISKINSAEVVT